jgi:hypothetical protein
MEIKLFEEDQNGIKLYGATIYINKKFFKEIGGLSSVSEVLIAISENDDILENLNTIKWKKQ